MVGTNTSMADLDSTYLRKVRKPMIEKKRRERMNQSISQLKQLIAKTIKQNTAPMTRVDKADILELTVVHLQQLQRQQQQQVTMATGQPSYSAGYTDCAREVMRYVSTSGTIGNQTIGLLNSHLHNTYRMTSQHCRHRNTLTPTTTNIVRRSINQISTPVRHRDDVLTDLSVLNCSPIQYGQPLSYPGDSKFSSRHPLHDVSNHETSMSVSSNQDSALNMSSNHELSRSVSSNHDSGINVSTNQESYMNISIKREVDDSYLFNQESDLSVSSYNNHECNVSTSDDDKSDVSKDNSSSDNTANSHWRPW